MIISSVQCMYEYRAHEATLRSTLLCISGWQDKGKLVRMITNIVYITIKFII